MSKASCTALLVASALLVATSPVFAVDTKDVHSEFIMYMSDHDVGRAQRLLSTPPPLSTSSSLHVLSRGRGLAVLPSSGDGSALSRDEIRLSHVLNEDRPNKHADDDRNVTKPDEKDDPYEGDGVPTREGDAFKYILVTIGALAVLSLLVSLVVVAVRRRNENKLIAERLFAASSSSYSAVCHGGDKTCNKNATGNTKTPEGQPRASIVSTEKEDVTPTVSERTKLIIAVGNEGNINFYDSDHHHHHGNSARQRAAIPKDTKATNSPNMKCKDHSTTNAAAAATTAGTCQNTKSEQQHNRRTREEEEETSKSGSPGDHVVDSVGLLGGTYTTKQSSTLHGDGDINVMGDREGEKPQDRG